MPPRPQARWNILVYLNAKNSLEPFSFPNFKQMANVGSTDAVNILVEFGRQQKQASSGPGGWGTTLRFRVGKGMAATPKNALEDLGQVNMGDPATLVDFVHWSRQNFPADRTMLIIWDHGQGWRGPTDGVVTDAYNPATAIRGNQRVAPAELPRPLGYRWCSLDEDTGDKLYNREIQDGLSALLAGEKLDVIGYDACLMGMLETGYSLRDVASVMVGSQELEPGSGWDYEGLLAPLAMRPDGVDAAAMGRLAVAAYKSAHGNQDDATLSAVDLTQMGAVADAVNAVADAALADFDASVPALHKARTACSSYAPGYPVSSIDLKRYMDHLASPTSGASAALRGAATGASQAVHGAILANHRASSRAGSFGSAGLGIYFPASQADFNRDPDQTGYLVSNTINPVEFVQTGRWAPLIARYLAKFPG